MTTQEFSAQYKANRTELLRFAVKLTYDKAKAEDVLQDAILTAYRKRDLLDNADKFKSWMSTILYNTFINSYRSKKRRKDLMADKKGVQGYFFNRSKVDNKGYQTLVKEDIEKLADQVGEQSIKTFFMYTEGYSYKEIAEEKNIAVGTVKSRIHFARTKLKTLINATPYMREVA